MLKLVFDAFVKTSLVLLNVSSSYKTVSCAVPPAEVYGSLGGLKLKITM